MLLGVAGFVKGDWLNVKPEDVKKVADHGFVSALLSIPDPSAGSDKDIANIKSLYAQQRPNHADDSRRLRRWVVQR